MDEQNKFEVSLEEQRQMMIDDLHHCCLCGSELVFKHEVDYLNLQVREEADCPSCKVRMKTKQHGLN